MDYAGNKTTTFFDSISFDFTPPQIHLFVDSYINEPHIKFDASEALQFGKLKTKFPMNTYLLMTQNLAWHYAIYWIMLLNTAN